MNTNPYEPPKSEISEFIEEKYSAQEISNISEFFNMLIIFFFVNLIFGQGLSVISIVTTFALVGSTYYLVKYCRIPRPWLYVALAFIPLVNLISLVVVIRKASAILKENGYKIGLLGSKKSKA